MATPAQIIMTFQSSLRAMDTAIRARSVAEEGLASYLAARAAETQAERQRREQEIEGLKVAERSARDAAARAKSQLDGLIKGVELGEVEIPEPGAGTPEEAQARITELEGKLADQEQKVAGAATELDTEAKRLDAAVKG